MSWGEEGFSFPLRRPIKKILNTRPPPHIHPFVHIILERGCYIMVVKRVFYEAVTVLWVIK